MEFPKLKDLVEDLIDNYNPETVKEEHDDDNPFENDDLDPAVEEPISGRSEEDLIDATEYPSFLEWKAKPSDLYTPNKLFEKFRKYGVAEGTLPFDNWDGSQTNQPNTSNEASTSNEFNQARVNEDDSTKLWRLSGDQFRDKKIKTRLEKRMRKRQEAIHLIASEPEPWPMYVRWELVMLLDDQSVDRKHQLSINSRMDKRLDTMYTFVSFV
ncbi:hypothetical protein F53441_5493 [Fusarium austroafricanum]|uniref:Uncharacterized protein n=1 Tax=Fusarium austroafricanum TaxID=2364996 RepID=A0A8H4KJR8_9HYPO|nr:hypothetical protein F53441_5493 [Fusarium austroafricanum]